MDVHEHDALKPCPFCNSNEVKLFKTELSPRVCVTCFKCGARTNFFESASEAIDAWDKRYDNSGIGQCPFCGDRSYTGFMIGDGFQIACHHCFSVGPWCRSMAYALGRWSSYGSVVFDA